MKSRSMQKTLQFIKELFNAKDMLVMLLILLFKLLLFNKLLDNGRATLGLTASVIGASLVLTCWFTLLPGPFRKLCLYLVDCGVTFLIISDLYFFRYFNDVISMPVLTQASNVSSVKSSIASLIHLYDAVFLLDLIALPVAFLLWKKLRERVKGGFAIALTRLAVFLVIGSALCGFGLSELLKSQPNIFKSFYDRVYIVQNIGLLSFHSIDAFEYLSSGERKKEPVAEEKKKEVAEFLLSKKADPAAAMKLSGEAKGKNLIIIQVEALQEFVINRKINGKEITPNLNKFLNRSIYFDNYYCETAGGGTSDAEFLANCSLFPVKDGSAYIRFSGNEYYSLSKRLKEEGYNSIAMHAYKPGFWNRSMMYQSLGFDEFFNRNNLELDEIVGMGLSDKSFLRQSLAKLKTLQDPYYAFIITLTSHYPFDADKSFYGDRLDVGSYKNTFFGNYLEAIHYADEALGYFLDELEKGGRLDKSVIALYGDHYAIPKDKKADLAKYLDIKDMDDFNWVKQQKTPFMIHLPGDKYAGINHTACGGVDVMPTLLNILGVDTSAMPMLGQDVLNAEDGLAVMRHGYFMTNKYLSLTSDGAAFEVDSGKSYPLDKLSKEKEQTNKSLEYSDIIIENNLIGEMRKYLEEHRDNR